MKILELCEGYPGYNGLLGSNFVKTRNFYYKKEGLNDITVLNFELPNGSYEFEEIKVISLSEYKQSYKDISFDVLVCHAANVRSHYQFLKKYQTLFPKVVFFFHGHEVLSINKEYPKPYPYQKKMGLSFYIRPIYDKIKFRIWHNYFIKQSSNVHLVFVSKWIQLKFEEYIKIDLSSIQAQSHLISNGISHVFETEEYDIDGEKEYDFITIRPDLDEPKYAVDVVNNLAHANPQYKFLLVGKGEFFKHFKKAGNIEQIERFLSHDEILLLLNKSRCALMPTKNDTQGIMACEMATFGMPTITSDLDVCKIIFDGYPNVRFISNDDSSINLSGIIPKPSKVKIKRYFYENTIVKEVELLNELGGANLKK